MKTSDKVAAVILAACVAWLVAQFVGFSPAVIVRSSPIESPGLAALVLYDDDSVTPDQAAVINSATWRVAIQGLGGEWLAADVDDDLSPGPEYWGKATTRPRSSLPWVVVGDGATGAGFEGPLPETPSDMVDLVTRIGGGG